MKSAILTDLHFGVKSDSDNMLDMYEKFFSNTFFPYLKKHNIKHVFDLGDVFHNRQKVNTKTLARAKSMFFDVLERENIQYDVIVGNHDIHYLNRNDVNSPALMLAEYDNVTVHEEATYWNDNILLVPWINKDNYNHVANLVKSSKAKICMGHFAFAGYYMNKYQKSDHGLEPSKFKKFDKVFSGHFHTKNSKDNITYMGSPFQQTWIDSSEKKFFHIFDHDTLELQPIENPYTMFEVVSYDNSDVDVSKYVGKNIKLSVEDVDSQDHLNSLLKELENVASDVSTVYNHKIDDIITENDDDDIEVENTLSIIQKYVKDKEICNILVSSYKEVI